MAARLPALLRQKGSDLFVPLAFTLSRRMEQASLEDFVDDPGLVTFALNAGRKAFHADGVINWFDGWLEAESAGVKVRREESGRVLDGSSELPAAVAADTVLAGRPARCALEVAARLCQQGGDEGVVLGYLTGPATLAHRLDETDHSPSSASAKMLLAMGKAYLEAGVSALLLAEEVAVPLMQVTSLRSLLNLAEYFETPVIMLSRVPLVPEASAALSDAGFWVADRRPGGPIGTLSLGIDTPDKCLEEWRRGLLGARRLILSAWDIAPDTAPTDIAAIGQVIKRH